MYKLLLSLLLAGCSTASTVTPGVIDKPVRHDLAIKVDGKAAVGTMVVPAKDSVYQIEINSNSDINAVFIETCHRHWVEYTNSKQFKFTYQFNGEIEKHVCPLKISALQVEHSKKEYATIAFQEEKYKLTANVRCNGRLDQALGIGLCQGKNEKVQEIDFAEPVKIFSKCPLPAITEGQKFYIPIQTGSCVYAFSTLAQPFKEMILFTLGYTEDENAGDDDD